ncbi:glyceraldehyde-3-phosphate dehydrogenase-like [Anoplophora glabripennis]|uniref:glyceraldehyde-3-phosphate dehydrogenase-like n=1 Tax=Anoplophora glabripennis TaxID=217634 RepID=UPI000875102C|nr:glyceraldehyde-3-phosphate dehydrogenase-like [Anoplophora glabripennis]
MVKIGINGFGRLGRQLLKVVINKYKQKTVADLPRLVMINDAELPTKCVGYLIRNDTYYGKFAGDIVEMDDSISVDGLRIEISREPNPEKIQWSKNGVEYIIDTTGKNTTCNLASKFLRAGVKRVIVTGCSNVPMFIVGVNHACFTKEMKSISAATPSMNCLAVMMKVLHENFEIEEAMATAFHPLNSSDKILDDPGPSNCRSSRSAIMSFSPTDATTKKEVVDKIMPELEGKTESAAIKIPVACVGGIDLTVKFKKNAPAEMIRCKLKDASDGPMKEVLGYSDEELVSSDLIGNSKSCVIDSKSAVNCSKCTAKIFAWYDAEHAFASRLFDLAKYISSREDCAK